MTIGPATEAPATASRLRQLTGSLLRSQQLGLVVVLLVLGAVLTAAAGSHDDPLTGALMRRALVEVIEQELQSGGER